MMPRVSASIRKPLLDDIKRIAKKLGVTQSFMVGILLEKAVEAHKLRTAPRLPNRGDGE